MSNVSIYEKNWTDLVFEDKNKAYGAYQLRQENSKTTLLAFIVSILFLFSLIGSWLLFSSFGNKTDTLPIIDDGIIITLSDYNPPKKEEPKKVEAVLPLKKAEETKKIEKKDLVNVTLVKREDNPDDIKTNKELKETTSETKTDGATTSGIKVTGFSDIGTTSTLTKSEGGKGEGLVKAEVLDRLPAYPGGIKKFYEYIINTVEKPEVDESSGNTISVLMSFVIEKDGSMTDIKVLRSSDKNLERESIRVLKALKVKWSPGFKDGEKVRTLYTLPIKVAI